MADASPLGKLNELADKYKVTGDKRLATDLQLNFVRSQVGEMKQVANRLLFDLTLSELHSTTAKDDATKFAYDQKAQTYANELKQMIATLEYNLALERELENQLDKETQ